ncbi:MAG: hypothetical protein HQL52_02205 [Magnetococcales bacterium]|nr:hypothetical protein [Magnetococcales bacterium]
MTHPSDSNLGIGMIGDEIEIEEVLRVIEDGPDHPGYDDAWEFLAKSRNPVVRKAMRMALEEIYGSPPPPTGYDDEGEPYWRTAVMAEHLGVDEEELTDNAMELREKWGDASGVMETKKLNRVH